jgi:glutamate N-acetyltransferase / amino-acid N-acetyltransferase
MIKIEPSIDSVKGFRVAGVHAGLKKDNALDFAVIRSNIDCVTAGVFTTNKVKAAPVLLGMERLNQNPEKIRAVVINSGNANACTGWKGMDNARKTSDMIAEQLEVDTEQVLVMSTGVIGQPLPMTAITNGVELACDGLGKDWEATATAIMTTDTHPKWASAHVMTAHGDYTIAGIVKGAGMIAPNMATMLSVVVTDAKLTLLQTQESLKTASQQSYNRIVVDGDTSTNDTVFLMANGMSTTVIDDGYDMQTFQKALNALTQYLAQQVVRDGEGVTKFITLDIKNAESQEIAEKIGHTIASSVLTKTAFYGNDANWGRIIASAGRAGVSFDPDKSSLFISPGEELFEDDYGLLIFENGMPTDYQESQASEVMAEGSIYITLDCGMGDGQATIWTCDISHEYVSINADYRT